MSGPDKMYASKSTRGQCVVSFATPSEEYCIPYTRTATIPDPLAIARAALEAAADAAKGRILTVSEGLLINTANHAAAAIRALANDPAALAEIVGRVE